MSPSSIPFHLLTKPAGAACNLRCSYCFFLSKEGLYQVGESALMTEHVLEIYIRDLMEASPGPTVAIASRGPRMAKPVSITCAQATRPFFTHIDRPMKQFNKLLQEGRSADQVMRML